MKRGGYRIFMEELIKKLDLPTDFKIGFVCYNPNYNTVDLYGYSDDFDDIIDGMHPQMR